LLYFSNFHDITLFITAIIVVCQSRNLNKSAVFKKCHSVFIASGTLLSFLIYQYVYESTRLNKIYRILHTFTHLQNLRWNIKFTNMSYVHDNVVLFRSLVWPHMPS